MSGLILYFPECNEVKKLMKANNINSADYSYNALMTIEQTIFEIRQVHGKFDKKLFNSVVTLLNKDWLPSDIPVILPRPFVFE